MAGRKRHVARSEQDLAAKRNQILDAAMALLAESGFARITMSDVAKAAGVGRGTVYWHYPSKSELFFALLKREMDAIDAALLAGPAPPEDPVQALELLVTVSCQLLGQGPNLMHAFLSVMTGADEALQERLHALFQDTYRRYNQLVIGLLEQGKATGQVRGDLDSAVIGPAAVAMLDAMFLQVEFDLVPHDPDRLAAALLTLLRGGWAPRGDA